MRSRLPLVRSLAAWVLAVAVAGFGLGLDWLRPAGPPSAGAGDLIGNPFGGPGARCGALTEFHLPGGNWTCSHGADPPPKGVDIHRRFDSGKAHAGLLLPDNAIDQRTAAAPNPNAHCYGDGLSGERVQAIYARSSDHTDQYSTIVPYIQKWAAEADAVFNASAGESGGTRHIRWQTDPVSCLPTVDHLVMSPSGDDDLAHTIAEVTAAGYNRPDRKYVVWVDANELCGISSYYEDDRPTTDNFNNGNPLAPATVSRIDNGCWGLGYEGESIEAHEIMHALGSVMPTAPHSTVLGHCTDGADRMCYADATTVQVLSVCASSEEAVFDCHKDDYFNAGSPGGYLANHWNTARNAFLATTDGLDPVTIVGSSVVEGDIGTKPLNFTVSLSVPENNTATVNWATADGTAVAGEDYQAAAGTITFAPGEITKTISVNVVGDFTKEPDEYFTVNLSNPVNAGVSGAAGRGTILNDDPKGQGYWLAASDGGIFSYADCSFHGSTGNIKLNQPIVGMASTPSGLGYWMVARDGGIFSFGDASFHGSTGNIRLNQPIVGMAAAPSGLGYWMVAADGGVFAFDAPSLGSAAGQSRVAVVAIAPTRTGQGYWVVAADGQIFNFGDADNFGSTGRLSQPIVGAAATPSGLGLWLVARDGGIFAFGDAGFFGSTGNIKLAKPIVGMSHSPSGNGYWLVASDGGIFAFGDSGFYGSTGNIKLAQPIVGMGALPHPLD